MSSISPLMACRLIPLDKNPGLRPIGIGEVLRRITGKAVLSVLRKDVEKVAGGLQLCAGQNAGCEAGIHAMVEIFQDENVHGIIQVDASNAFNRINRKVMLKNLEVLCPELATYGKNCYGSPARLFVTGGVEIRSNEGTTQGCPFSMPAYALAILPLMSMINSYHYSTTVKQVAFADDLCGAGKLASLKIWWDMVNQYGPHLGYYAEPTKSWLIVKQEFHAEAQNIFRDTGINISVEGRKHLGAVLGSQDFKESFVRRKVDKWVQQVEKLASFARVDPHLAYSAFTHGLRHTWTYTMRTIPDLSSLFKPLDAAIDEKLLPALFNGRIPNELERKLMSLPVKFGGMSMIIPSEASIEQYKDSKEITRQLAEHVICQKDILEINPVEQKEIKVNIRSRKMDRNKKTLAEIEESMESNRLKLLPIITENAASNWLTAIPIQKKGFYLNKQEFWDALCLRYGYDLKRLPVKCVCDKSYTVEHALSCKKGGFICMRHNELRDLTAELLSEVCKDVALEPKLIPLTGENLKFKSANVEDESRLDVSARSFWSRSSKAFFDIRIFNPMAPSYNKITLAASHSQNEKSKKREYNERVLQVEHGTFTPLVFSCYGGMSKECSAFFKRLAVLISEKRDQPYYEVSSYIRTRISFGLLRMALVCIRGSRAPIRNDFEKVSDVDIVADVDEAKIKIIHN